MPFYIHIADPSFPEPPWPGERRLGPFPTSDEALEQAISDAAIGAAVAIGVFSEAESERRRVASDADAGVMMSRAIRGETVSSHGGKASQTRSTIARRGASLARKRADAEAKRMAEDRQALLDAMPESVHDLIEGA